MSRLNTEITLQVLDAEDSPVGEPLVFSNALTPYGLSVIDPLAADPDFPQHYIHIGAGYLPDNPDSDLQERIASVAATVSTKITEPNDLFARPVLRTRTLSAVFPLRLNETEIREIGIGSSGGGINSMYTYTHIKTADGRPHTITLRANEKLYVTYRYQVLTPAFLPNNMVVSGNGLPEGVIGCMYPVASSSTRGYYYYDSEEDYITSGWGSVYTDFYNQDDPTNSYKTDFGSASFSDLDSAGSSNGHLTLLENSRLPSVASLPNNATGIDLFGWSGDSVRYVVAIRLAPTFAVVFSRPIPLNNLASFALSTTALFEAVEAEYTDSEKYNA